MKKTDAIADIADGLLTRYPACASLYLKMGNAAIDVRSNSLALLTELNLHFKEFIGPKKSTDITIFALEGKPEPIPFILSEKQPDPGKTKIKEEFIDLESGRIVRKRLTGMMLFFDKTHHVAFGPCLANVNQVVNFINNRFIEWMLKQNSLLAHAAGIVAQNRGLALAGFSGSGKSTLALQLLCSGATFVSNDRLLIQRHPDGLKMYGIPKHPRVNPGTILSLDFLHGIMTDKDREAALKMETDALWNLESKHDVIVHEHFGPDKFKLAAPMHGLLILNWKRTPQPLVITEIDIAVRRDLLDAFIKSPGLFFLPDADEPAPDFSAERYIAMLSGCRVFEATGGVDFAAAVRFCRHFLGLDTGSKEDLRVRARIDRIEHNAFNRVK